MARIYIEIGIVIVIILIIPFFIWLYKNRNVIKRSKAVDIAKRNTTLKTDFCRNSNIEGISYIGFDDYTIDIIKKEGRKYWQFQVISGKISWITFENNSTIYNDGRTDEEDCKYLRCLIDVKSGDYIYYPDVKKYKKRIVKYEDAINERIKVYESAPEWLKRIDSEIKEAPNDNKT